MARRRPRHSFPRMPLYADAFQAVGFGLLRFIRDGEGRVVELSHGRDRIYDIRFERIGD